MKKLSFILLIFIFSLSIVYTEELPSIKYVNSNDGLNCRDSPSVLGERLGTLLHGSRFVAHEKSSRKETIDDITDFWYRCSGSISGGGFYWVFGGYLSDLIPDDTDPFLGYWDTDRGSRDFWHFFPDHTVNSGRKETDIGWIGTWELSGDKIIIRKRPIESYEPIEHEILEIVIKVINRNRIDLHFSDGSKECLTRNNGLI
jgi:hypothetical protein